MLALQALQTALVTLDVNNEDEADSDSDSESDDVDGRNPCGDEEEMAETKKCHDAVTDCNNEDDEDLMLDVVGDAEYDKEEKDDDDDDDDEEEEDEDTDSQEHSLISSSHSRQDEYQIALGCSVSLMFIIFTLCMLPHMDILRIARLVSFACLMLAVLAVLVSVARILNGASTGFTRWLLGMSG